MRQLTPTLLAAQRDPSSEPVIRVLLRPRIAETLRPRWERLWSGSEGEALHALAVTGADTLVRCRVMGAALQVQRVPSPGPESDFAAWQTLDAAAGDGIAAAASGARVLVAFVGADGVSVRVRESVDDGATFGVAAVAAVASMAVGFVGVALRQDGDAAVFDTAGGSLYAVRRTAGIWGPPAASPYGAATWSGLSAAYDGDFCLALAGSDPGGGKRVWTLIFGDGERYPPGAWGTPVEVMTAEPDSPVTFARPSLSFADRPRLCFVEASSQPVAYSRAYETVLAPGALFTSDRWREPAPLDFETTAGVAIGASASHLWRSAPSAVWYASRSDDTVDVTADVVSLETDDRPDGGRLRVTLRNDHVRARPGEAPLAEGWEVELRAGYRTAAGEETVRWQRYWVDRWHVDAAPGRSTATFVASDAWGLLAGWRARRQFAWSAGDASLFEMLAAVLARAGLRLVASGASGTIGTLRPAFTVNPGVDGATAARALLRMVRDVVRFDGAEGAVTELSADEAPSYVYGLEHPWRSLSVGAGIADANRVRVTGAGVSAEAYDWDSIEASADRLAHVQDRTVADAASAAARAEAALRQLVLDRDAGEAVVPANVGQQMYDVVRFVDAAAGIDVTRRVRGLKLRFERGARARFDLMLRLGPV